jgi:hypothetical protein
LQHISGKSSKQATRGRNRPVPGGGGGGNDGLDDLGLDPLLIALLKKIPSSGERPAAQRVRWFRTFAMNISQIYDNEQPVEMKIDLDRGATN